jgi:hypothetical protein
VLVSLIGLWPLAGTPLFGLAKAKQGKALTISDPS